MAEKLMTIDDLAEYLKLSKSTLYRFVSQKVIPHHKIGRSVRFDKEEIDQWIDSGEASKLTSKRPKVQ